jgi:hypothetical protein
VTAQGVTRETFLSLLLILLRFFYFKITCVSITAEEVSETRNMVAVPTTMQAPCAFPWKLNFCIASTAGG